MPIPGWPDQGVAFDAAVHLGTAGAFLCSFAPKRWRLAGRALAGRASERRLGLGLVLGTGPAALAGVLFERAIETRLRSAVRGRPRLSCSGGVLTVS